MRLGVSPITQKIYCGKISKDGKMWVGKKHDVTEDFIKLANSLSGWRPIEDFEIYEGRGYLTIHRDDLYPVAAFCFGKDWYRLTEGPEDVIKPEIGDLTKLLRPPTHLKEIVRPDSQRPE